MRNEEEGLEKIFEAGRPQKKLILIDRKQGGVAK